MCIAKVKVGLKVVKAGSTVKQDRKWLKHIIDSKARSKVVKAGSTVYKGLPGTSV